MSDLPEVKLRALSSRAASSSASETARAGATPSQTPTPPPSTGSPDGLAVWASLGHTRPMSDPTKRPHPDLLSPVEQDFVDFGLRDLAARTAKAGVGQVAEIKYTEALAKALEVVRG